MFLLLVVSIWFFLFLCTALTGWCGEVGIHLWLCTCVCVPFMCAYVSRGYHVFLVVACYMCVCVSLSESLVSLRMGGCVIGILLAG